ncbi:hypothetical protein QBC32DRAFT_397499 [Pseudoneurospora amorphoporcata]|uniref:Uncharacterized protein n=1 Tax=Pseudoneurospora amorphoporcata TaxID=241081 RepID=A0AAN6NXR7_9PEZI|nr:hypothetical protein QBC32DRAFT_397499 [Pseudoneurospora amorphoporcata]
MAFKPSQQVGCGTGASLLIGDKPMNWRSSFCCSIFPFIHHGSGLLMNGSRAEERDCSVLDQVFHVWVWTARPKKQSPPFMEPPDDHPPILCETIGFSLSVSLLHGLWEPGRCSCHVAKATSRDSCTL